MKLVNIADEGAQYNGSCMTYTIRAFPEQEKKATPGYGTAGC